ncbi:MAG: hypothetical protein ABI402_09200 [Ferruginibacter sp.]
MPEAAIVQMPGIKMINEALSDAGSGIILTEKNFIDDNLQDHFYTFEKIGHIFI